MANFYDSQLRNRNFLSPIGFKFTLKTKEKVDEADHETKQELAQAFHKTKKNTNKVSEAVNKTDEVA